MMWDQRRRVLTPGFTLIEILVVVAIIALLISILLPSLQKAREQGKAVVCGTSLDSIFKASFMYAQSNKEHLPYFGWYDPSYTRDQWWITQISKGIGNQTDVFKCPSDDQPYDMSITFIKGKMYMWESGDPGPIDVEMTYRGSCDALDDSSGTYVSRKVNSWKFPSRAILLIEAQAQWSDESGECFRFQDHLLFLTYENLLPEVKLREDRIKTYSHLQSWRRHGRRSNMMFADGHIGRPTLEQAVRLAFNQEKFL
jgi:prepilin-type N-terminal cleavage/methylation domain-containing protein/prepilin-type processing-associated H-X9-DG protein